MVNTSTPNPGMASGMPEHAIQRQDRLQVLQVTNQILNKRKYNWTPGYLGSPYRPWVFNSKYTIMKHKPRQGASSKALKRRISSTRSLDKTKCFPPSSKQPHQDIFASIHPPILFSGFARSQQNAMQSGETPSHLIPSVDQVALSSPFSQ